MRYALAAALLCLPGLAHAAQPPCITPAEFSAILTYSLPSALDGVSKTCGKAMPTGAFLPSPAGQAMIGRYAALKPTHWPSAKQAFTKMSGGGDGSNRLFDALNDSAMQQVLDTFVTGLVVSQLPIENCPVIDRTLSLLAPLPPETTAQAVSLAIGVGARSGHAPFGKVAICTP